MFEEDKIVFFGDKTYFRKNIFLLQIVRVTFFVRTWLVLFLRNNNICSLFYSSTNNSWKITKIRQIFLKISQTLLKHIWPELFSRPSLWVPSLVKNAKIVLLKISRWGFWPQNFCWESRTAYSLTLIAAWRSKIYALVVYSGCIFSNIFFWGM